MKSKIAVLLLVGMMVYSCGSKQKYVVSEEIDIEFWGDIEDGDWIEIDGMKIYHVTNDTLGDCNLDYEHNYLVLNEGSDDKVYMPSTSYFTCLDEGNWVTRKLTFGDLAQNLISVLNEFGQQDSNSLQLPYRNENNTLQTTLGKLRIRRTDGKKIRVTTSEGYKGAVQKVNSGQAG
ncbi:hypothetical protein [Roseivirga sp.]|uniref:hypothetical protein n=1 Tax=Roseivirga sp. TaxID=1964215 RepID=UPI003B519C5A